MSKFTVTTSGPMQRVKTLNWVAEQLAAGRSKDEIKRELWTYYNAKRIDEYISLAEKMTPEDPIAA